MFGFLKKKIKEGIKKITKKVEEKEPLPAESKAEEKLKTEEQPKESTKEVVKTPRKEKTKKETVTTKPEKRKKKKTKEQEEIKKKEEIKEILEKTEPEESKTTKKKIEQEVPEKKEIKERKEVEKESEKPAEKPKPKRRILGFGTKRIEEKDIEDVLWDFQISLLESDVALETAEKICDDLKKSLVGREVKKKEIEKVVEETIRNSIKEILDLKGMDIENEIKNKKPYLILFLGFNGSGKTTTIARLAHLLKKNGFSVIMAAADTWRAAAIDQLEKHGKNLGIPVIKHKYGADAAAVVYDAVQHAKSKGIDVILADTAGRSHTNTNLMEELKKICRVNNPDLKILVVDSLTGNDAIEQARAFDSAVGIDAIILTKMDVNEKGGAALSVTHTIKKPILFIGTGQGYEDLEKFDSEKMIKALLE
ncbi:MAG: signal recognition particle-docking protein FtsY [Candidatus Aenigmarchaeota archaeon]|nr:signal recognition particle-docking protein FtsY [Candidatus Aenigmarchaeota archaeon]